MNKSIRALALFLLFTVAGPSAWAAEAGAGTALVTGANRGIGLELATQLQAGGYEVIGTARDGVEAVEMAMALEPDVALLDLDMPRQGGIEATRQIHARRPIPIVIVTAYHSAEFIAKATQVGAGGFLVKPVDGAQLRALVPGDRVYVRVLAGQRDFAVFEE